MWRAALLFSLPFGILTDLSESARVALSVSIRVIKPVSLVRPKTWRSARAAGVPGLGPVFPGSASAKPPRRSSRRATVLLPPPAVT